MAKSKGNSLALPDELVSLLAAADTRAGFPVGTMASIMQQEVGGNVGKYIQDPTAYHYPVNDKGQRIAAHTGKISTAFGPFGILESTAKDPGFGVTPLKDKSLAEQVRFAADYLKARSDRAGGLKGGLAGYGEGAKYAQQVSGRLPVKTAVETTAPVVVQAAPAVSLAQAPQAPMQEPQQAPVLEVVAEAPQAVPQGPDPWQEFLAQSRAPVQPQELQYAQETLPQVKAPEFLAMLQGMGGVPQVNFTPFTAMRGRV